MNLPRVLAKPAKTFLLRGPRGTGKSTWLDEVHRLYEQNRGIRFEPSPVFVPVLMRELRN